MFHEKGTVRCNVNTLVKKCDVNILGLQSEVLVSMEIMPQLHFLV